MSRPKRLRRITISGGDRLSTVGFCQSDPVAKVSERLAAVGQRREAVVGSSVLADEPLGTVSHGRFRTRLDVHDALTDVGVQTVVVSRHRIGQVDDRRILADDGEQVQGVVPRVSREADVGLEPEPAVDKLDEPLEVPC